MMLKFVVYGSYMFTLATASIHLHYGKFGYALFNGGLALWILMWEHKTRD